jgi:hypothetical protein
MANTMHLELPLLAAAQSQKHVTHNEAVLRLDAVVQLAVKDRDLTAPPGSPTDGDRYIVASGATGAWASWDLNVAWHHDGVWTKLSPREGWRVWVEDENLFLVWNGSAWGPTGKPLERGFWINDGAGANIWGLRDRVLVGDAADHSGHRTGADVGLVSSWIATQAGGLMGYFDRRSQMEVLSSIGAIAIAGASRSSDNGRVGERSTIGFGSFVNNDNPNAADKKSSWAVYGHAVQSQANHFTTAMEVDVCNLLGTVVGVSPYVMGAEGTTAGLWVAVGGETAQQLVDSGSPNSPQPVDVALGVVVNPTTAPNNRFRKGIVFHADALLGTNGQGTGTAIAIEMARGHEIRGKYGDGSNANTFVIRGDHNNAAAQGRLIFTAVGPEIRGVNADLVTEHTIARFVPLANTVNFLSFTGAAAGGNPVINAAGADTNVHLRLVPKGTGEVRLLGSDNLVKIAANATGIGFFAATPAAKQSVSGSRGGNAALASLLTALASYGLITNGTTA